MRESVSVQLDGELPELELDRLETHLRVCPECAAWADEVRGVTAWLREAPLETPTDGFVLPRRPRRRWTVSSAVALASAAAVVATLFVVPGRQNASLGSLGSLAAGPPSPDTIYDVTAGVVYPPHAVFGGTAIGVSAPIVVPGPVRPL